MFHAPMRAAPLTLPRPSSLGRNAGQAELEGLAQKQMLKSDSSSWAKLPGSMHDSNSLFRCPHSRALEALKSKAAPPKMSPLDNTCRYWTTLGHCRVTIIPPKLAINVDVETLKSSAAETEMRVLIQQIHTGRMLTDKGDWTDDEAEAIVFRSTVAAIKFALERHLTGIQFVLRFSLPESDIVLPFPSGV